MIHNMNSGLYDTLYHCINIDLKRLIAWAETDFKAGLALKLCGKGLIPSHLFSEPHDLNTNMLIFEP